MEIRDIKIECDLPDRLDRVLTAELRKRGIEISRSHVKDLIEGHQVSINGSPRGKAGSVVGSGDLLSIERMKDLGQKTLLRPKPFPLDILYEDEGILVVNKPQGLTVHPGAGTGNQATLIEAVIAHVGMEMVREFEGGLDADEVRPGIVHRLDRDTSGVMVIAKTRRAHGVLAQAFKDKTTVKREYITLMEGRLPKALNHESWLKRDEVARIKFKSFPHEVPSGRWASSYFEPLAVFAGPLTLARVVLKTGRTHQIRLHALDLGAPILGDPVYRRGGKTSGGYDQGERFQGISDPLLVEELRGVQGTGQFLHAFGLEFIHPLSGRPMKFIEKYPDRFRLLVEKLTPFRAL